jgi:hypothetical protein
MIDKRKFLELDISKVRYNSKGVIDFYWPYDKKSCKDLFGIQL